MVKTKFLLITVAIVILDQLTKFLLKNKFIIITNFLYLNYTENKGASFGLFQGYNLVFIFISIFIIFLMFKFYKKVKNNFKLQLALSFLLGGIIGNLIDRIFRGFVIDFIDFRIWPVFNVADSFNVIGAIILVFYLFKK